MQIENNTSNQRKVCVIHRFHNKLPFVSFLIFWFGDVKDTESDFSWGLLWSQILQIKLSKSGVDPSHFFDINHLLDDWFHMREGYLIKTTNSLEQTLRHFEKFLQQILSLKNKLLKNKNRKEIPHPSRAFSEIFLK